MLGKVYVVLMLRVKVLEEDDDDGLSLDEVRLLPDCASSSHFFVCLFVCLFVCSCGSKARKRVQKKGWEAHRQAVCGTCDFMR